MLAAGLPARLAPLAHRAPVSNSIAIETISVEEVHLLRIRLKSPIGLSRASSRAARASARAFLLRLPPSSPSTPPPWPSPPRPPPQPLSFSAFASSWRCSYAVRRLHRQLRRHLDADLKVATEDEGGLLGQVERGVAKFVHSSVMRGGRRLPA